MHFGSKFGIVLAGAGTDTGTRCGSHGLDKTLVCALGATRSLIHCLGDNIDKYLFHFSQNGDAKCLLDLNPKRFLAIRSKSVYRDCNSAVLEIAFAMFARRGIASAMSAMTRGCVCNVCGDSGYGVQRLGIASAGLAGPNRATNKPKHSKNWATSACNL